MSIICAAIKNKEIAISSDTQSNFGPLNISSKHIKNASKLYQVNDSIIGAVGWLAISDMLEHLMKNDKELFKLNNRMNIFSSFQNMHTIMKENYYIETKEEDDQPVESSQIDALIINKHGLFSVSSYREVNEFKTFWAIGSGQSIALGAMHTLYERHHSAKEIVEAGVAAATEFDESCGMPLKTKIISL